jgi:cell division septation protein DedD
MARGPSPRRDAARRDAPAPWLDEAEEEPTRTLMGRGTLWLILLVLAVLVGGVAIGVWLVARQAPADIDAPPPGAELPLVRNPGPWKIPPEGPGTEGEEVEGQGQVLFGTGDGRDPTAAIALDAVPEEPMALPGREPAGAPEPLQPGAAAQPATAPVAPAPGRPAEVAVPRGPPAPAPSVARAPAAGAAPAAGGATIQLGAFSSEARARAAWKSLSERFGYLSGLTPAIVPTAQDGKTLYRLRTSPPDPATAADICRRLKVAGEACTPV